MTTLNMGQRSLAEIYKEHLSFISKNSSAISVSYIAHNNLEFLRVDFSDGEWWELSSSRKPNKYAWMKGKTKEDLGKVYNYITTASTISFVSSVSEKAIKLSQEYVEYLKSLPVTITSNGAYNE